MIISKQKITSILKFCYLSLSGSNAHVPKTLRPNVYQPLSSPAEFWQKSNGLKINFRNENFKNIHLFES